MSQSPEIAVIGGGTGSFTLLQELKHCTQNISAVVNMSDDGGSSGRLREEFGILPPGDVRQCLVALAEASDLRDVFGFRFGGEGPHAGHSMGNLMLAGLTEQHGSFAAGVKAAESMLNITGRVIPVTLEEHVLALHDGDEYVEGEFEIGHRPISEQGVVSLRPPAPINPEAAQAITDADMVVIAPGNLYGSLLPALVTNGMAEALHDARGVITIISNLVNKPGQSDNWHVVDYVKTIERHVGADLIDVVLYNQATPSADLLERYAAEGEHPVRIDEDRFDDISAVALGANLVAGQTAVQDDKDKAIRRTLIRHDAAEVGRQLMRLL